MLLFDLSFFLSKEIELNETHYNHYKISNKDGKNMEKVNSITVKNKNLLRCLIS